MIEGLLLKELLGFRSERLSFDKSLIVFTGPSGAGKSVLMSALLGGFGFNVSSYGLLSEMSIKKPKEMQSENYDLEDELFVRVVKKEKVRFFLNDQNISKKSLEELFAPHVKYLSVRDKATLDSKELLSIIDGFVGAKEESFSTTLREFKKEYEKLKIAQKELEELQEKEQNINDLIEYAKFEIEKINTINPKKDEHEELIVIKQKLSKVDKVKESIALLEPIFEYENKIADFYRFIDGDFSIISDAFNKLRLDIDEATSQNSELDEMNIETILDRIESLSSLQKKYGSIEEALDFRDNKQKELESFEHIIEDKSHLEMFIENQTKMVLESARVISAKRGEGISDIVHILNPLLRELKLPNATFELHQSDLSIDGIDMAGLLLGDSKTITLSGGEFNRLRLALLVASTFGEIKESKGVIFFDEIDANVSGDESIAIANMLLELSRKYQVFAISHQPHLAAKANQHILVFKDNLESKAKILDREMRIQEIARIISGENRSKEAVDFANMLLS